MGGMRKLKPTLRAVSGKQKHGGGIELDFQEGFGELGRCFQGAKRLLPGSARNHFLESLESREGFRESVTGLVGIYFLGFLGRSGLRPT